MLFLILETLLDYIILNSYKYKGVKNSWVKLDCWRTLSYTHLQSQDSLDEWISLLFMVVNCMTCVGFFSFLS